MLDWKGLSYSLYKNIFKIKNNTISIRIGHFLFYNLYKINFDNFIENCPIIFFQAIITGISKLTANLFI